MRLCLVFRDGSDAAAHRNPADRTPPGLLCGPKLAAIMRDPGETGAGEPRPASLDTVLRASCLAHRRCPAEGTKAAADASRRSATNRVK